MYHFLFLFNVFSLALFLGAVSGLFYLWLNKGMKAVFFLFLTLLYLFVDFFLTMIRLYGSLHLDTNYFVSYIFLFKYLLCTVFPCLLLILWYTFFEKEITLPVRKIIIGVIVMPFFLMILFFIIRIDSVNLVIVELVISKILLCIIIIFIVIYSIIHYNDVMNYKFKRNILNIAIIFLGLIFSYSALNTSMNFSRVWKEQISRNNTDIPYRFEVVFEFFFIPLVSIIIYFFLYIYYKRKPKINELVDKNDPFFRKFQFSDREAEIASMVLNDKSNKEISMLLFISYGTVKNHIYSIFQKCNTKNRKDFIALYKESL